MDVGTFVRTISVSNGGGKDIITHSRSTTLDHISAGETFSDTEGWHIISTVWNGTDSTLNGNAATSVAAWLDGTSIGSNTGANANPTTHDYTRIGAAPRDTAGPGSNDFEGQIAAVLIYTDALGAADVQAVEAYLYDTYIPEPGTLTLLAVGGLALLRRRRRR